VCACITDLSRLSSSRSTSCSLSVSSLSSSSCEICASLMLTLGLKPPDTDAGLSVVMATRSGVMTPARLNPVIRTSDDGLELNIGLLSSPTQFEEYLRPRTDVTGCAESSRMRSCVHSGVPFSFPFPAWSDRAVENLHALSVREAELSSTGVDDDDDDDDDDFATNNKDHDTTGGSELEAIVDVNNNGNARLAVDGFDPEQSAFDPDIVVVDDDDDDDDDDVDVDVASINKDLDSTDGSQLEANNNGNARLAVDGFNPDESAFDPDIVVDENDDIDDDDDDDDAEIITVNPGSESPEFEIAAAAVTTSSDNAADVAGNCKQLSTGDKHCRSVFSSQFDVHVEEFDEVDESGVTEAGNRSDRIPDVIVDDLDSADSSVVELSSPSIDPAVPAAPDQCNSDRDRDFVMPGLCCPSLKQ